MTLKHQKEFREFCERKGYPQPPVAPPLPSSILSRSVNSMLSPQLVTLPSGSADLLMATKESARIRSLSEGTNVSSKENNNVQSTNEESLNELKKDNSERAKEGEKTDLKEDDKKKEDSSTVQHIQKLEGQISISQEDKVVKSDGNDQEETASTRSQGSRKSSTDLTHIVNTTQPKQQLTYSHPIMSGQPPMYSFPGMYQQFGYPPSVPNMPSMFYPNMSFPNPGMWNFNPADQQQQFQGMPSMQQQQPAPSMQRPTGIPEQGFQIPAVSQLPTGTSFVSSANVPSVLQSATSSLPPNTSSS